MAQKWSQPSWQPRAGQEASSQQLLAKRLFASTEREVSTRKVKFPPDAIRPEGWVLRTRSWLRGKAGGRRKGSNQNWS
jgi:hypothetical protein